MTTRMDAIERLAAELRALYADADWEIATKYGCRVQDIDKYDHRIGCSIRDIAHANMIKWGEW